MPVVLTTVFVVPKQEESNADLPVDVCPLYICMYMYIFSYTFLKLLNLI